MNKVSSSRVVVMFSGGLDSILSAKLLQSQGIDILGLHCVSPFFGFPEKIDRWEKVYGLKIRVMDIGDDFARMLVKRPVHGFGKTINPCVDCKILMLRHARSVMEEVGACAIATGEVLGQRPMSQRRDTLHVIQRDAGVKGVLLRPLSALHLDPCDAEIAGIIDRSRLLGFSGRGRKSQLSLAAELGLTEIPTPAGGCRLAEKENARNYWNVIKYITAPLANDFYIAGAGRQFWSSEPVGHWLIIGRNQEDNDTLMRLAKENDILLKSRDFVGPVALLRSNGVISSAAVETAAALTAGYSPKSMRHAEATGENIVMRVHTESLDSSGREISIIPTRETVFWKESMWEAAKKEIRAEAIKKMVL